MLSTARNTIRGWCLAHHSESGTAGIHIRGSISLERELSLALDSDWVSLWAMGGVGPLGIRFANRNNFDREVGGMNRAGGFHAE